MPQPQPPAQPPTQPHPPSQPPLAFTGDTKVPLVSPLAALEKRFITANVGRVPPWLRSHHLTLMTILWSAGLVLFGWLAARNRNLHWLWLSSLMLALQWLTDCFDGAAGRARNEGLKKWGFYMDHLLDFIFMSLIFVGYAFLVPDPTRFWLFIFMLVYGAFMAHSFLDFGATGGFKITYLGAGPTEIRLLFIILNTVIIFAGTRVLIALTPWLTCIFLAAFCIVVYQTHKKVWAIDMAEKNREH